LRLSKAWVVASKEFSVFRTKKSVVYGTILFPLVVSIGLPLVIEFAGRRSGGIPAAVLPGVVNSLGFFFIIGAAVLPTGIASFSLVGEKIGKSLEPLLATPTSDGEILLGKSLAAFLPPIVAIYIGAAIFMALIDRLTYDTLGYLYYPNWSEGVVLLLVAPLVALLSVEFCIVTSARVNDVRSVQQLGALVTLPFAGIYVGSEIGILTLDVPTLLYISAVLLVVDLVLFRVSTAVFRREEILTKWK
jgi:ABC-2 type transport system permease protein